MKIENINEVVELINEHKCLKHTLYVLNEENVVLKMTTKATTKGMLGTDLGLEDENGYYLDDKYLPIIKQDIEKKMSEIEDKLRGCNMNNFSWLTDFLKTNVDNMVPKSTRIDEWDFDGNYCIDASNKRCNINENCKCKKRNEVHICEYYKGKIQNGCSDNFYYSSGVICSHPKCVEYAKEHKNDLYKEIVD